MNGKLEIIISDSNKNYMRSILNYSNNQDIYF